MSEENNVATEAVSEGTTEEASTSSTDVGALVAESKKYRKRSQDAETRLAKLESQLANAEVAKLKEVEDFKTLYEKTAGEMESYKSQADKWTSYETKKRESLLESVPEGERGALADLPFEALEYVTNKINSVKANVPEVAGNTRQLEKPIGDWTTMSKADLKDNWATIVKNAENKQNK